VTGEVSDAVIISYVAAGGYLGRIDFILHEQKEGSHKKAL
jgi:hypothetical protein